MAIIEDRQRILRDMKVCRFCLNDEGPFTNIYEKNAKETKHFVPLPLQIMACIAIEVFPNDGMPQLICRSCRNHAIAAYTFKANAKKVDDSLKLFAATGQLAKPALKPFLFEPSEQVQIVNLPAPGGPNPKKRKTFEEHEGEIITLNYDPPSDDEEPEQDEQHEEESQSGEERDPKIVHSDYILDENNKLVQVSTNVKTDCFPCPHCERSFPLKQLLDLHVNTHDRERNFACDECGRGFYSKYDLNKHVQTHLVQKPFPCVVCNKTFARETLLHRHEKIHNEAQKHHCDQCDKTFVTQASLDLHMEKHNKKRPFTCPDCHKSFVFKQGLERHVVVHTNDKPHKCNYCEASFTSAIKLARHVTTHAGLRPYPCKLCGRTFLLSHHLTRHMRSHYAAQSGPSGVIGQHKCDICSMAFRRKDSLINHSAIHSMVNLRCVICSTSFDNAKMVKEHITTHLSGLSFACEKCDYSFQTIEQLEEHEMKHAEMEYEEQIEKEVIEEQQKQQEAGGDSDYDTGEVDSFTITNDINNPEVRRSKRTSGKTTSYAKFLREELGSDLEDPPYESQDEGEAATESADVEEEEVIKPIVRSVGTKVYSRKSGERKIPNLNIQQADVKTQMAPLETITQSETVSTTIEELGLGSDMLPIPGGPHMVSMKMGDKKVRVQKYIVTKDHMKEMAKKGILQMCGNTVVLKNPGQPILNATLKPANKVDIATINSQISKANIFKSQSAMKTYPRRTVSIDSHEDEVHDEYVTAESLNLNDLT